MITAPAAPTFEHLRRALGVGVARPRLSWIPDAGTVQAGYELQLTLGGRTTTTGRVDSPDSVLLPWPFPALNSRDLVRVRVRVHDRSGDVSDWSQPGTVETGLLTPADWTAQAVTAPWPETPGTDRRPPLLRTGFTLDKTVVKARLYATAHGLYEFELNGHRVGDDILSPGWTVYGSRLRYYTYDVTDLLVDGENALGAWTGDGWYRGRLGFHGGYRDLYGDDLALIGQLEITYDDGTTRTVVTDGTWTAAFGPIVFTELYNGETFDARALPAGWSAAGFDATGWQPVTTHPHDASLLVAPDAEPVRCTDELTAAEVLTTPSGRTVLDFGQNAAGRLQITVTAPAGTVITLHHAEVMQDGELFTRTLREAASVDTYTCAGTGTEVWEPRFTIHGFRYAQIDGWPGDLDPADVVFRVCHTDAARSGWFTSSNPLLDRLHDNVVWSLRSNFVDIPTDCPQRDERLGWTGDIQVFGPTASFLYDCAGMLTGWLKDVAAEQLPDGTVPWYVPVIPGGDEWTPIRPGAAWGDVAVLLPWTLYQRFGDTGILAQQYDSARAWVDLMDRLAGPGHLWNTGFQLGDWLDPAAPPHDPGAGLTDRHLVATAYFAWSTLHLAKTAEVLGRTEDALRYRDLAERVRLAFVDEYVNPDGTLTSDAQTGYAIAIMFDLLPEELRHPAGDRLAELVRDAGHRIATGFAGTPLITDALTVTGHLDEAYGLLLETECPSWLYTVNQGGTTIWERWDSLQPDGTVNPGGMTSFNHYALGAVADWMHRTVAGIAPDAPGYRRIRFAPRPGGGLTHAAATHHTPYGTASVAWRLDDTGALHLDVTVPAGTTGVVDLPDGTTHDVAAGDHHFVAAARPAALARH